MSEGWQTRCGRAVALAESDDPIRREHLSPEVVAASHAMAASTQKGALSHTRGAVGWRAPVSAGRVPQLLSALRLLGASSPDVPAELRVRCDQPLAAILAQVEREAIQQALTATDGHVSNAARLLGISRKGLFLKRHRLGVGSPTV